MSVKTATSGLEHTSDLDHIRQAVRELSERFPATYWRQNDQDRRYPEEFVQALSDAGWLSAMIPAEYGGGGLRTLEAGVVLEEINRCGGNAAAGHAQMYTMGVILRHGSVEQKRRLLPEIAAGRIRLQAFAITEPDAGSDTTAISTSAEKRGDTYVIRGRKIFISRVQHSDYLLLLARTSPREDSRRRASGLSVFLVDLRQTGTSLKVTPIQTMVNHETSELLFEDVCIPAENLIGEEGRGFEYILSGLNAERVLVASESLGRGYYLVERSAKYAGDRIVFGRPIGQNQAIQLPIAQAFIRLEAAALMRDHAARRFDQGSTSGSEANMAKWLASEAAWEAANVAMTTFGGYGMAVEYDIERIFREARLSLVAPVANHLVLAHIGQHVLGMPRSY